jgi:putative transposase
MKEMYSHLSLKYICRLFGKSRQGWYDLGQHKGHKEMKNGLILEKVREIRTDFPKMGSVKLRVMVEKELQNHHLSLGRDTFLQLLRDHDLLIKKRRSYVRTTNANHHFKKWPDLLNRRPATTAEEIWVSDITYLRIKSGFVYLALVTDAYSRKIVGYNLSRNLKAEGCISALKMAFNDRIYPQRPLIHHSDRGIQYCCDAYVRLLERHQVAISMTQTGSPYDNAIAERINGILKMECELDQTFTSFQHAGQKVLEAVTKYNHRRPHFSCQLNTPQYRHAAAKENQVKQFQDNHLLGSSDFRPFENKGQPNPGKTRKTK